MAKFILGIVLSIGIIVSGVMLVDTLDLLSDAAYDNLDACVHENRDIALAERSDCFGSFSEQRQASDSKEKLLGGVLGLILAGLGWLLAWVLYIKPRRRVAPASEG
jgi:hypothetical protein